MITPNYRDLLREELVARIGKNSQYSTRAFARDLGVSAGFLSQVMSGKRKLSETRSHQLSEKLAWPKRRRRQFQQLVRYELVHTPRLRQEILDELNRLRKRQTYADLEADRFSLIQEWYHLAILEMAHLKAFRSSLDWIAHRLGIRKLQAEIAVKRLQRMGLLRVQGKKWTVTSNAIGSVPSGAIRHYHDQFLDRARTALSAQDFEKRDFSGITMAIDSKKLPEAKKIIQKFRHDLNAFLADGNRDQIYHLSVQLFRLDQEGK